MQRCKMRMPAPPAQSFSILGRIGGDATHSPFMVWHNIRQTFSILGRIGGDATVLPIREDTVAVHFQYPRSDRRRCNALLLPVSDLLAKTFSILGRIGGDATHPSPPPPRYRSPFQYPRSDRRRCNSCPRGSSCCPSPPLSVSSVGSEAMQLCPLTATPPPSGNLSVSSVGSEAMQPVPCPWAERAIPSFSILGRIGGDATQQQRQDDDELHVFQYPRSDRRRCNAPERPRWHRPGGLSVSSVGSEAMQRFSCLLRSVSSRRLSVSSVGSEAMQPSLYRCQATNPRTFSILGRIGGDATPLRPPRCTPVPLHFQYPRSDRRRCND